jgi:serine protease Do
VNKNRIILVLSLSVSFLLGALLMVTLQVTGEPVITVKADSLDDRGFSQFQDRFRSVAAENLPMVVEIDVMNVKEAGQEMSEAVPWDDFFSAPDTGVPNGKFDFYGLGSGIIIRRIDNTYYVITNYHVIGDSDQIKITLHDNREFEAETVGRDTRKDLALVSFESDDDLPIARIGDSSQLYVGDWVLAIGNPLGYESSVTAGIISALDREDAPDGNISNFIQTDAAINQGNSGGALVNMQGELVGINTWISTSTGGSMGLGFSLPIDNAIKSIEDIITYGQPRYGWLGVSMGDMNGVMKTEINVPTEITGAYVYQVFIGSPAWKGGLRAGDFIYSINSMPIKGRKELTYLIGEIDPGETIPLSLYRNGFKRDLTITIESRGEEDQITSKNSFAWPGVMVLPLNESIKNALSLDNSYEGVIVEDSYAKTPFQIAGLQVGDVIYRIDGNPVTGLNDFYRLLGDQSQNIFNLSIKRLGDQVVEMEIIVRRED